MYPLVFKYLRSENKTIWHYYAVNVTVSYELVMCFFVFVFHPSHLPQNDRKNILRHCNKVQLLAFDNILMYMLLVLVFNTKYDDIYTAIALSFMAVGFFFFFFVMNRDRKVHKEGRLSYADFVWFLISEEDKKSETRCEPVTWLFSLGCKCTAF